jgi:hypothetical protein
MLLPFCVLIEKQPSASVNPTNHSINSFEVLGGNFFFKGGVGRGPPNQLLYYFDLILKVNYLSIFQLYYLLILSI